MALIPSLISICIPTCNRPELLREALQSCVGQEVQDFQILIGDDSRDDGAAAVAAEFESKYPGKISYVRNVPSLGQASNVNSLFGRANGERLVLLHDDDVLMPNALAELSACWDQHPDLAAAFGRQYQMTMAGRILVAESEASYSKFEDQLKDDGLFKVPVEAGIRQLFRNDGFMVLTSLARDVGYRPLSEVGQSCDFDFGLRLCWRAEKLFYVNKYVSAYRFTDEAISKTAITVPYLYKILNELKPKLPNNAELLKTLAESAPAAASGFARLGNGKEALKILLSGDYPMHQRFSKRFIFHCMLTFASLAGGQPASSFMIRALSGFVAK